MLESLWLVIASVLVLMMQGGFLLLEAGSVRTKNAINVAQKNISDLTICWVVFSLIGFTLMFGLPSPILFDPIVTSGDSVITSGDSITTSGNGTPNGAHLLLHFVYQLGFCGAAATMTSGCVAERMRFVPYLGLTALVSLLIYPIVGWSIWGNLFIADRSAWLADLGFLDFAGATVVHSLGAWVALIACWQIKPRQGRFSANGEPQILHGHSAVLSTCGTLLLLIGWIGFNLGSLSITHEHFGRAFINTLSGACFGALSGMVVGWFLDDGVFNPSRTCNGMLSGLISVTACAAWVVPVNAVIIAIIAGVITPCFSYWLLHRLKLDDPLDVIATHGLAGVWGTLAVAIFAEPGYLSYTSRLHQLWIQILGAASVCLFASGMTYATLLFVKRFTPLRVSASEEKIGLNYIEHGISLSTQRLKAALDEQADTQQPSSFLNFDEHDDGSEIAHSLQKLLGRYETAQQHIGQQAKRFKDFANTTSDFFWETDANLNVIFLSPHFSRLADQALSNFYGRSILEIISVDSQQCNNLWSLAEKKAAWPKFESYFLLSKDAQLPVTNPKRRLVELQAVPYSNAEGSFAGYRGTANDLSAQRMAEKKAMYLAYHDELTGLENRRRLDSTLKKAIDDAQHHKLGVVVAGVDLDGFKGVNDSYGHSIGDKLLKQVANRIITSLRTQDFAYRVGGDEFIIILNQFNVAAMRSDALDWSARLIEIIKAPYSIDTISVHINASIGISCYPDDHSAPSDLIRMADLAMYKAKQRGKGTVVSFEVEMDKEAQRRKSMETGLRNAFKKREFFLRYQPKVEFGQHLISGFEALVRWRHPDRGEVQPNEFIPTVEQLGMMVQLGDYVLNEACQFAAKLHHQLQQPTSEMAANVAPNFHIAINVSPSQLNSDYFITTLQNTLSSSKVPPSMLELEITEDMLIRNLPATAKRLQKIRDLGVHIVIDDFGRGCTSLQYLQQLPISKLKIDRSFVKDLNTNTKSNEIAKGIVLLAHQLGVTVTAEGIEQLEQKVLLQDWQCDEGQGYYYGKPMAPAEAKLLLQEWNQKKLTSGMN